MGDVNATLGDALGTRRARISVGGQTHEFAELGVDNLEAFAAVLAESVELLALVEGGFAAEQLGRLIARAPKTVIELVRAGARVPADLMQRMSGTELRLAARAVLEVNQDFFVGVLEDLAELKPLTPAAGSTSSSDSSAPATA